MKFRPVGATRTDRRTDGQTDIMKLIVDFRNFANAHENGRVLIGVMWFTVRWKLNI